jgi:hypothetical protein
MKRQNIWQGGGAVTQRFAKPYHTGSNPVLASKYSGLRLGGGIGRHAGLKIL